MYFYKCAPLLKHLNVMLSYFLWKHFILKKFSSSRISCLLLWDGHHLMQWEIWKEMLIMCLCSFIHMPIYRFIDTSLFPSRLKAFDDLSLERLILLLWCWFLFMLQSLYVYTCVSLWSFIIIIRTVHTLLTWLCGLIVNRMKENKEFFRIENGIGGVNFELRKGRILSCLGLILCSNMEVGKLLLCYWR